MRGWVGVQKEVSKKMAGLLTGRGFQGKIIYNHPRSLPRRDFSHLL
jgi:hypothetical protein